jgi:hypothetical protein
MKVESGARAENVDHLHCNAREVHEGGVDVGGQAQSRCLGPPSTQGQPDFIPEE